MFANRPHLPRAYVLTAALAALSSARAADLPSELKAVLAVDAAQWQAGPVQGVSLDLTAVDGEGRRAVAVGPNGLVLTTAAPLPDDAEVVARLRFTSPKEQGSTVYVFGGLKKPEDRGENPLHMGLSLA